MDLALLALEEISYEGLEGTTVSGLWKLIQKRRPPVKCAIDKWTKPFIWNKLASSPYIDFYHVDYDGPKQPDITKNPGERNAKMPPFWINDHINNQWGYCQSYFYRTNVSKEIKGGELAKMSLDDAEKRWGEFLYIVASQDVRRRYLYGFSNPPIIDDVIPVRYIILEIIGKTRWEGFMQADFLKFYGMDPRTSFHHIKVLIRLHLITKQSILLKGPVNNPIAGCQPVPPKSTKMLHLSQFSNVYTNNLQKAAAKICSVLDSTPDGIMERNELKNACSDIPMFKKIRQWLFQTGHIQYIVNGEIWNNDNRNPIQISHFRAGRPCYVNMLKKFDVTDVEEDTDEFIDYIENCDDIEPQLVYEETLHHQAYRVIVACKSKGITMKKLAEVMCVPFIMARSFIRFFDSNKLGRMIYIDHLKQKLQKIVAIQYLHESETVQSLKSNKQKIEKHKASNVDVKPSVASLHTSSAATLAEKNLELADELDLQRVTVKSNISIRQLSRKNYVMDALKERPVFEGTIELYKSLVLSEENLKSTQGQCCRKTFRKILNTLVEEEQIKKITSLVDDSCVPPITAAFYCAIFITENSPEFLCALDTVKTRHHSLEKKKELKKAVLENSPKSCKTIAMKGSNELGENPSKVPLDFNDGDEVLTDTDDESFKRSTALSTAHDVNSRFMTYARFQKLHVLHIFLWHLVYGVEADIDDLLMRSHSLSNDTFIDLVQSRHIWLQHVNGLPDYKEGLGWFNVGDILALMPLEVTCRVLGIKCWSETAIKFLEDPKKRLLKMCELPPRLKYKLLVSHANKHHIDNCVDLLVLLAQMGLVAVSPTYYPKIRTEIMLFLRKEAKITDTRFSEKTYCHVVLPPDVDKFPETEYHFKMLADVEKYWTDLQFVCLNTPLGLNRSQRTIKSETVAQELSKDEIALGKQGLNQPAKSKGLGRNFRSFTILRDFTQYYQHKDFSNLEPVVFGNGLGAGGLDAVFFAHLAKNWRYGKQRVKKAAIHKVKSEEETQNNGDNITADKSVTFKMVDVQSNTPTKTPSKIVVTNLMVKQRRGGKGLKRKLAVGTSSNVLTKKMKMERKKYFDRMIAKRIENVREKVRQKEQIKKKGLRKGKKILAAMNHDDVDRAALRRMKGIRVSFSEREDAYILLAEIVRAMMKLYEKGQPLEKEHKKVVWQAFRDLIHKEVPESCDKTWEAIDRRARNIKKYPHFLIMYNTCMAELEQDKEFLESLKCTKDNWKEKMVSAFAVTRESYSRHFNYPMNIEKFPVSIDELNKKFHIEFAHKEVLDSAGFRHIELQSEREVRTSVLEDLIHCSLTAQKLTSYIPAVAFKVFDAYPPNELNEAFDYYKRNKLISRYRVDLPRRRSLPISTMTYNLSTTYYRMFEPVIPLRIYQTTRSMYLHVREGKEHSTSWKEADVTKLPNAYEKGSCLLNCANMQGGHVAYLLSAIANKKILMDFSLPDEMTVSDEMHLKKLKEGRLNYQRVAFEQRIRRGETLVEKKLQISGNQQASSMAQQGTSLKKNTITEDRKEDVLVVNVCGSAPPESGRCTEISGDTSCQNKVPETKYSSLDKSCKRTISQVQGDINMDKKRQITFDIPGSSKESVVHSVAQNRSANMRHHGVIRGFLNSNIFFCSYSSLRTPDPTSKFEQTVSNDSTLCFMYTNEMPKTKRRLLAERINMFKESKLHASRTSLSMQRSLTGEKLVPTNAMNTHDALVTNPMEIIIHAKLSPFRNFLMKLKGSTSQKEVWKRCCENAENDDEHDILTPTEYCAILSEHMKFSQDKLKDHLTIINKVRSFGIVGIKLNDSRDLFPMLSHEILHNWEYHIQVLLSFRMLYAVGHYDELLIAPLYLSSWCFRYPQVTSRFENEITPTSIPSQCEKTNEPDTSVNILNSSGLSVEDSVSQLEADHRKEVDMNSKNTIGELCEEQDNNESISNTVEKKEEKNNTVSSVASITYKNIKVLPWLKLNGELNNVILKRIHETILVYIMSKPGILESQVLSHFALLLKPASAHKILNFLEINGAISKHYTWKKKKTMLFNDNEDECIERIAYFMPTMHALLNMTDTNR